LWLVALVLGSSFAWEAMWLGQVTGIVVSLIFGAWILAAKSRDGWAGVLLGAATFKPTLVAIVLWWFVLQRRWRLIGFAVAASVVTALYAMITLGPVESVTHWLSSLSAYQTGELNQLGSHRVLGVMSAASAMGVAVPSPTIGLTAMIALLTLGWWWLRDRLDMLDQLAFLTPLTPILVYAHPHEALLALPMVVSLWRRWVDTPWLIALLVLWGALSVPERAVDMLGLPILMHWRTAVLLILWGWWLAGVTLRFDPIARGAPPRPPKSAGTPPEGRGVVKTHSSRLHDWRGVGRGFAARLQRRDACQHRDCAVHALALDHLHLRLQRNRQVQLRRRAELDDAHALASLGDLAFV
jgi:hypothetical protein